MRNQTIKLKTTRLLVALSLLAISNPLSAKTNSGVQLKAEMEKSVLYEGKKQNALIKITINAPAVNISKTARKNKVNLVIVLDKSGSMSHSGKIKNAKIAATTALRQLGPQDLFSMVVYDSNVQTLVPPTPVKNRMLIEKIINTITPGGSTALFAGVSVGANEIRKNISEGYVNRIILLSDGLANVGPNSPKELGRLGTSLIKEGISVSTVGVGSDYNEDLMTALAQNSDGNFYFVENSNDLPMIFSKELGSALRVAAKAIRIHIEFPEGVTPQGILGHNCIINKNSIDLFFNQVYGGHEKSLILQVEVPPENDRKKIDLASIRLNYKDAITGTEHSAVQTVAASFSKDKSIIAKSYNKDVMNEIAIQRNAVLKTEAIKQADKGNFSQAQQLLEQGAKQLEETAEKTGNVMLNRQAKRSKEHANELEKQKKKKRFGKNLRKKLKGESYQDLNAQFYKQ